MLTSQAAQAQWEALCKEIMIKRDAGQVIITRAPHVSCNPSQAADQLVTSVGWVSPPEWRMIDKDTAIKILTQCLNQDLAYDTQLQPRSDAQAQATAVVDAAGPDAVFFTNGELALPDVQGRSWTPLTDATFDTGVVAIGKCWSVLCWFLDED